MSEIKNNLGNQTTTLEGLLNEELSRSLFDRSQERYEGAKRWYSIVLLILIIFHIAYFHPFIKAIQSINQNKQRIEDIKPKLETIMSTIDFSDKKFSISIEQKITDMTRDKIKNLSALFKRIEKDTRTVVQ